MKKKQVAGSKWQVASTPATCNLHLVTLSSCHLVIHKGGDMKNLLLFLALLGILMSSRPTALLAQDDPSAPQAPNNVYLPLVQRDNQSEATAAVSDANA